MVFKRSVSVGRGRYGVVAGPCLVLEAADGSPHLISDERLSELGWPGTLRSVGTAKHRWDGIELLVLCLGVAQVKI